MVIGGNNMASAIKQFNELNTNQRAERKLLLTVVEWNETGETNPLREVLGTRTEDSSIEYNMDISTTTDIRGINYTDINKSQPQQDFDPYLVLGGSRLGAYLNDIRSRNALSELSDFTVYVITAFISEGTGSSKKYAAERHTNCTITYTAMGGDTNVNFPISLYLSNYDGTTTDTAALGHAGIGTVNKLASDFTFTLNGSSASV